MSERSVEEIIGDDLFQDAPNGTWCITEDRCIELWEADRAEIRLSVQLENIERAKVEFRNWYGGNDEDSKAMLAALDSLADGGGEARPSSGCDLESSSSPSSPPTTADSPAEWAQLPMNQDLPRQPELEPFTAKTREFISLAREIFAATPPAEAAEPPPVKCRVCGSSTRSEMKICGPCDDRLTNLVEAFKNPIRKQALAEAKLANDPDLAGEVERPKCPTCGSDVLIMADGRRPHLPDLGQSWRCPDHFHAQPERCGGTPGKPGVLDHDGGRSHSHCPGCPDCQEADDG